LERYSIITNTWTLCEPSFYPAGASGIVTYQDSLLYAIGGMGTSMNPSAYVQLYNQNSNSWRTATPLPSARANGWVWVTGDTIYYGCGVGPTTTIFNNNIFKGIISQSDRSVISWTVHSVKYPLAIHRCDADIFGCYGVMIGPGAASWWGTGNACYTWSGGANTFVSAGFTPFLTASAMVGAGSFQRGTYRVWKFVVASGMVMSAPFHILNTQIYTDSCLIVGIINKNNQIPEQFSLSQNYPNPFNPVTKIRFSIPPYKGGKTAVSGRGDVSLVIFDILGREVTTLVNERLNPGVYEVEFNGTNYPSGVYFYKLSVTDEQSSVVFTDTKRMVLIK
jgi:hypothetical protein